MGHVLGDFIQTNTCYDVSEADGGGFFGVMGSFKNVSPRELPT